MKILLCNDDGVNAPGICLLEQGLAKHHEVFVAAPASDQSGVSSAMTLDNLVYISRKDDHHIVSVHGTPVDCTHIGMSGLFYEIPDILISGVNAGSNLGDDVIYSGTVAAALEGRFLAKPAIAVSLVGKQQQNIVTAVEVVKRLVKSINDFIPDGKSQQAHIVLNVNVPDVPLDQLKGIQATRLGKRSRAAKPIETANPRGKTGYWIAPVGECKDMSEGTDFAAVKQGYASVTPIQTDLTRHESINLIGQWLEKLW